MGQYSQQAVVQCDMAARLLEGVRRTQVSWEPFGRILELGCGDGVLSRRLAMELDYRELVLNDLVDSCRAVVGSIPRGSFLPGDIETIDFPGKFDLIISNATIQWLHDVGRFFAKCRHGVTEEGVVAFSTFGPENFREIAAAGGESLQYPDMQSLLELLRQNGLETVFCHEEHHQLYFPSARAVLEHLKATGVGATGSGRKWTRSGLDAFCRNYEEKYKQEDHVVLTYHPILFVARPILGFEVEK